MLDLESKFPQHKYSYSPSQRVPSKTSEGDYVETHVVNSIDVLYDAIGEYALHIEDFIMDLETVFPTLGKDWGIYMPEVKYLSPEPLVNYDDLSLTRFPNVHFVGDALSARGITVSGSPSTINRIRCIMGFIFSRRRGNKF